MDASDAASTFTDDAPRLIPQLGALSFSAATPGDYRATFRYDRLTFRTTEISESVHVVGFDRITLGPGAGAGDASGCFFGDGDEHTSIGAYASADHKQHDSDRHLRVQLGGRGEWSRDARGWTRVSLALVAACDAPGSIDPATPRHELRCVRVMRADGTGPPALLCDDAAGTLRDAALPLGAGAAATSWTWLALDGGQIAMDDARNVVTVKLRADEDAPTLKMLQSMMK
jgi:hypothetical protein